MRALVASTFAILTLACGAVETPTGGEAPLPAATGFRDAASTPDVRATIDIAVAATVDAIRVRATVEAGSSPSILEPPTRAPLLRRGSKGDTPQSETASLRGEDSTALGHGPTAAASPSPTARPGADAPPTSTPAGGPPTTPTAVPTPVPTATPTAVPTPAPTAMPAVVPTPAPTATPTAVPTPAPTATPAVVPPPIPTATPTAVPPPAPTATPTVVPTPAPTATPTVVPTPASTATPTVVPTPASTATPTVVPTPVPTATRSPTPTPTVPPPDPSPALFLDVVALTSPITRGSRATLQARTLAGARCALQVTLPSGAVSRSGGTGAEPVAGGDGAVSWTWRIGGSTTPGVGEVRVECRLKGDRVAATRDLVVRAKA